jgi:hypothetical protein
LVWPKVVGSTVGCFSFILGSVIIFKLPCGGGHGPIPASKLFPILRQTAAEMISDLAGTFKDVKLQEVGGFITLIAANMFVKDRLKLNEYEEGALLLCSGLILGLVHSPLA